MTEVIICPFCGHVHHREQMYPMLQRFNIHNDEAVLKCFDCEGEFLFGYNEYYQILLKEK